MEHALSVLRDVVLELDKKLLARSLALHFLYALFLARIVDAEMVFEEFIITPGLLLGDIKSSPRVLAADDFARDLGLGRLLAIHILHGLEDFELVDPTGGFLL